MGMFAFASSASHVPGVIKSAAPHVVNIASDDFISPSVEWIDYITLPAIITTKAPLVHYQLKQVLAQDNPPICTAKLKHLVPLTRRISKLQHINNIEILNSYQGIQYNDREFNYCKKSIKSIPIILLSKKARFLGSMRFSRGSL